MSDDHDHSHLSDMELRVRTLTSLLSEKGYIQPGVLDEIIDTYENKIGPRNGAQIVAKAWVDNSYLERLRADATTAIAELGFGGRQGEHMKIVENTPEIHNIVVCTLCSCYPWAILGLPPVWYKSAPYRSRVVCDPRGVLEEFGVNLPSDTKIVVWDSTAEMRYLVIPNRPDGSAKLNETQLAALVSRDAMIGTGTAFLPESLASGETK